MRLLPGQTVGMYEVLDVIGQGGMSESYRARDRETGQTVVLKIPYANIIGDPATYTRYEREMEIGRRLVHPHIQRVLATGRLEGSVAPYIVTEYIEGDLLRVYLNQYAPLDVRDAVELALQLADALEACHQQGVIHRDLKPENVLLTADHQIKLMDFGIALLHGARRVTWSRLTGSIGTPDYMAPEQIRGQRGDARTDVYALGLVLFEMLAGSLPFEGDNPLAVMNQHVNVEAPRLSKRRPSVPPQLDGIVAKAIRRSPHQRYQSMAAFRANLEHYTELNPDDFRWEERPLARLRGIFSSLKTALVVIGMVAVLALNGILVQLSHGGQVGN